MKKSILSLTLLFALFLVSPVKAMISTKDMEDEKGGKPFVRTLEITNLFPEEEKIYLKSVNIKKAVIVSSTHKEGDLFKRGIYERFTLTFYYNEPFEDHSLKIYQDSLKKELKDLDAWVFGNENREVVFFLCNTEFLVSGARNQKKIGVSSTNSKPSKMCFSIL